jgi:hypothetical protein
MNPARLTYSEKYVFNHILEKMAWLYLYLAQMNIMFRGVVTVRLLNGLVSITVTYILIEECRLVGCYAVWLLLKTDVP